jgi:3'-phosphoadenosine 5'-phosphosulfate (PAPS) 3'-phosphatase
LWDACAGHCIAKEYGGGAYYFDGKEVTYNAEEGRTINKRIFLTCREGRKDLFLEHFKQYDKEI